MRIAAIATVLLAPALAACIGPATPVEDARPTSSQASLAPGAFEIWNETVESFDGTAIAVTVHKPVHATGQRPVPIIIEMSGWGESFGGGAVAPVFPGRCYACPGIRPLLDAGFGVVSISPRGWSDSGGESHALDPDYEARDEIAVIDEIATWDWVLLDSAGDPRLGATGFSMGGASAWQTALEETRLTGRTRFDALAPTNGPHDFMRSLAPNGVPKTILGSLLLGVSAGARVAPEYQQAIAEMMATGVPPSAFSEELHRHSPGWYPENGILLDVPVLVQQATTDLHFPLNEAWSNYQEVLAPEAREQSMLITHRNGHTYPWYRQEGSILPNNPCTASEWWRAIDFQTLWFRKHLAREDLELGAPIQLATHEGNCLEFDALPDGTEPIDVAQQTVLGTVIPLGADSPTALPIAAGPLTLAGVPRLRANLTTVHPDARIFFALGVGRSPSEIRILGDQWMPVRGAAAGGFAVSMDLAGVVETIPAGSSVFLMASGGHWMYGAHGSRAPGAAILNNARVMLPLVEAQS